MLIAVWSLILNLPKCAYLRFILMSNNSNMGHKFASAIPGTVFKYNFSDAFPVIYFAPFPISIS